MASKEEEIEKVVVGDYTKMSTNAMSMSDERSSENSQLAGVAQVVIANNTKQELRMIGGSHNGAYLQIGAREIQTGQTTQWVHRGTQFTGSLCIHAYVSSVDRSLWILAWQVALPGTDVPNKVYVEHDPHAPDDWTGVNWNEIHKKLNASENISVIRNGIGVVGPDSQAVVGIHFLDPYN